MTFVVNMIVTNDPDNYDEIIPYDSDAGQAITEAVLDKAGFASAGVIAEAERHTLANLVEVQPATLDTAILFHTMLSDKKGMTVTEVADMLSISEKLVRSLLDDGEIVGWRVKRRIVVSTKSLEQYLNENPY